MRKTIAWCPYQTPSREPRHRLLGVECDRSFDSYVGLLLQRLLLLRRKCEKPLDAHSGQKSVCSGEFAIDRNRLVECRNRCTVVGVCVAAVQKNGTQITV